MIRFLRLFKLPFCIMFGVCNIFFLLEDKNCFETIVWAEKTWSKNSFRYTCVGCFDFRHLLRRLRV